MKHKAFHWIPAVLLAALLAAVCVCVRMDVAGVERRVPKTGEIESVTAQCRNIQPFTATSGDTETIEAIRAIHRAILEQVEDLSLIHISEPTRP